MNNDEPIKFSIIIPVQKINDYVLETCQKLGNLKNNNFELIIFPDAIDIQEKEILEKKLKARLISTGNIGPAGKRDLSLKYEQGEYLAFLDDDAYPKEDWLTIAEKFLENSEVSALGGSQLTPQSDSFWQKVSGAVFLSPLSGSALIRYWPSKQRCEVEDWPTVNFFIKKSDFSAIGGFDSQYWPGEDTKLCLDIVKKLKKKIIYVPDLIVFHHRRSGLLRHLKQIGNYGLHRGYFAKKFPETSKKFMYFIPSLFVIFLIIGLVPSYSFPFMINLYLLVIFIYSFASYWTFYLLYKSFYLKQ